MKKIFKQFTHTEDTCSLHDVPSLYDEPYFFKNMIRAKYKAWITIDQWKSNASYNNIFLEASHAKNPLTAYWCYHTQNKVTRILCHKSPPCGGSKQVPLSHLCLWSIKRRHLLNWLGITTGWQILWEVQIYGRR